MGEEKSIRWEIWTSAILFVACLAWFIRDFRDETQFPFEPIIAFLTSLFALLGIFLFRKKTAKQKGPASINQSAGKIYNIGNIQNARFSIYVKGGYLLTLMALLAIGIWQKDAIKAGLGYDRFFKLEDKDFKILVLPFKQECTMSGKNYDAGYVLTKRLVEIARKENLEITVNYWSDYHFEDYFSDQTANELQAYHHADMLIYGAYQTSDCSAEGDQICLNYVTAEKWNLGKAGANLSADYERGGFDELKKGKMQEKVENIAVFISILAQIKSLDHAQYLKKLQGLLNEPDFSTDSKLEVYLELADKLIEEGNLKEPLIQYKKGLQIAIEQGNKEYQGIFLERLGSTHSDLGNLPKALTFFEKYNDLEKELHDAFPQNVSFKSGVASSYRSLGITHSALGNLTKALTFFEKYNDLEEELHDAFPQNVSFKSGVASSYSNLGSTHGALGNLPKALTFFKKCNDLAKKLHSAYPQNESFKNALANSYSNLGSTHSDLGNLPKALTFFEKYNDLEEELHDAFPQNVSFKNSLATSTCWLGITHSALGNLPKALTFFEKYNDLEEELHDAFPQNVKFKNGLAISYSKLGSTHSALGNVTKALTFNEKANQTIKELHYAHPQNVEFKNGLVISYEKLGLTHSTLGNLPKALTFFEKDIELSQELHDAFPQNVEFKNGLAISYSNLGKTHSALGNLPKALTFFEKCNDLKKELYKAYPQNVEFKSGLAISYLMLGQFFLDKQKEPETAKKYIQKGYNLYLELVRDFPDYQEFKNNYKWAKAQLGY